MKDMARTSGHIADSDPYFAIDLINYDSRSNRFVIEGSVGGAAHSQDNELVPLFSNNSASFTKDGRSALYKLYIPANSSGVLHIVYKPDTSGVVKDLPLVFHQASRIGGNHQSNYRILGNRLIVPQNNTLEFAKLSIRRITIYEIEHFLRSLRDKNIKNNTLKTGIIMFLRILALLQIKRVRRRRIWLFSDRAVSGGDNSEALFRYAVKQHNEEVKPYFAIDAGTDTYKELKKSGYNVVKFKSIRHLYLAMTADVLLPSHLDARYLYPWPGVWQKYSGLLRYRIAHTQHGLVVNDMSEYIGKRQKNAELFLSVCSWEQKYLTTNQYGYTAEETPITGAPRYDYLDKSATQKIIAVHPTWRSWLASEDSNGKREYSEDFKQSDYYKFYQRLINDEKIIKVLREKGYLLKFYLHPNHSANMSDFMSINNHVQIMDFPYDYKRMFNESAVFITDYSNTSFDFAYLRKPIIYTQFDADVFFLRQAAIKRQFFDYETDGFGAVCNDYQSSVEEILDIINRDAKMQNAYQKRADNFFTYSDSKNSERAYKAILKFF